VANSLLTYLGGKGRLANLIISYFPYHWTYVEPFGGAASVLLNKSPSKVEVYNDIDHDLVNFFRVLRDPVAFEQFHQLVSLTPYSREEHHLVRDILDMDNESPTLSPAERAHAWFCFVRMGFNGGINRAYGYSRKSNSALTHLNKIDRLPDIARRLMQVQVEHQDWRDILYTYDTPETLFYLDPPYHPDTRKGGEFKNEISSKDHQDLVDWMHILEGMVVLTCYWHPVYETLKSYGYRKIDLNVICTALGHTRGTGIMGEDSTPDKQYRTESIVCCPKVVERLQEVDPSLFPEATEN
jgi:DNA adenine methylase